MKFSHSLQFNAVPEWSSKYISYSHLKKIIYTLQRDKLYNGELKDTTTTSNNLSTDTEATPLLLAPSVLTLDSNNTINTTNDPYVKEFIKALDHELFKIEKFYNSQETGLLANYHELKDDIIEFTNNSKRNRTPSFADVLPTTPAPIETDTNGNDLESINSHRSMSLESLPIQEQLSRNSWANLFHPNESVDDFSPLDKYKLSLRKRLIAMFTQLSELKDYIELNHTGFSKICKKFDKSLDTSIKSKYLNHIETQSHVFDPITATAINNIIHETVVEYAKLSQNVHSNDLVNYDAALNELSTHLRDHIAWERNTVWKDMMNIERLANNAKRQDLIENQNDFLEKPLQQVGHWDTLPGGIWLLLKSPAIIKFISITTIFILLLKYLIFFEDPLEQNCFAILVYASLLWATETLPLFVTSLFIPFLIVILPVLKDPKDGTTPMDTVSASQFILSTMWSSVIMLLLGGFTLAAALSKYNIAKMLSTYILASAGTNPAIILLTNMFVALFVSMWVSNVASPVLCYSIIQPILRTLPSSSSYTKSLILGIALASNVGGMSSPIASPQNIFAFGLMEPTPSWGEWFIVSIPVSIICILSIWILLIVTFPPDSKVKILRLHASKDTFTATQWFVTLTSIGTILLWCFSNQLSGIFGEMGIISIIPILLFFGTGVLSTEDFNNFMWTIVILAMGGSTLGKAVSNCGLLFTIAEHIKVMIEGKALFVIVLIFGAGIITMATFVSHTVAAMILVPLMGEIGQHLPEDHSRLLIMITALLSSAAMGLPTSGFPNVTAISMTDEVGVRYLNVGNFISRGVPSSLFCYFTVVTVGYLLLRLILF
ncbi:low-affinity phosphate transporter [Monosporozyma unispora]|nr:low-affinity phosphate transporter [Kazachstania unispora]